LDVVPVEVVDGEIELALALFDQILNTGVVAQRLLSQTPTGPALAGPISRRG